MSEVTFSGNTIGDKALWRNGVERGKKDEQSRIIKLLEAKSDQAMRAGQGKPMPERMEYLAVEVSIRQVIALIKGEGENK